MSAGKPQCTSVLWLVTEIFLFTTAIITVPTSGVIMLVAYWYHNQKFSSRLFTSLLNRLKGGPVLNFILTVTWNWGLRFVHIKNKQIISYNILIIYHLFMIYLSLWIISAHTHPPSKVTLISSELNVCCYVQHECAKINQKFPDQNPQRPKTDTWSRSTIRAQKHRLERLSSALNSRETLWDAEPKTR